jgi:hypothetical protein
MRWTVIQLGACVVVQLIYHSSVICKVRLNVWLVVKMNEVTIKPASTYIQYSCATQFFPSFERKLLRSRESCAEKRLT